jgi:hypothetical protein
VTIDVYSNKATRVEKLIIGLEKKQALALDKISHVLIHCETFAQPHHYVLQLDSQSNPAFQVASSFDLQEPLSESQTNPSNRKDEVIEIKSLVTLARKIGELLKKPVIRRMLDRGDIISEDTIQA